MSTRGRIAIKENVKYKYIYNHNDSYINGLGITLYKYYKDVNKVKELIALGNTSSVGRTIEEGGSKSYVEHVSMPRECRGTVAMFRDINRWKDCGDVEWEDSKPIETKHLFRFLYKCTWRYYYWWTWYWNDYYGNSR